jgi:hypothetical protein
MNIQITPVEREAHVHAGHEAPYRTFIAASLALGIGGGFLLALLLPLAAALEWDWGTRWQALAQVHGQLQLLGFAGLFVMGMSLRLMPRFSGRMFPLPRLVPALVPLIAGSLVLRAVAQPASDSLLRDAALLASALLLVVGAVAYATIICGTLVHRDSKAEATGYFFVLGALAYVAGAAINLLQVIDMTRDGLAFAPLGRQPAMVFAQQFGFIMLISGGVVTRAVPTLTGRPRADLGGRITACALAAGVSTFVAARLYGSEKSITPASMRLEDAGLILMACGWLSVVWLSGALRPSADRVAAASHVQFQLVRSALGWLAFSGLLTLWYASRAFLDAAALDAYQLDAIRHALTVGVLTMLIMGMAMLIVPEFAGRRLQHPNEGWIAVAILVALNASAMLRVWPALEGIGWIASTRWWPMTAAGGLAEGAVVVFALMFAQSYIEQRQPRWASPEMLSRRGSRS